MATGKIFLEKRKKYDIIHFEIRGYILIKAGNGHK